MSREWGPYLWLFLASLIASLVLTPVARRIACAVGAIDKPSARRINRVPIPRMGGIAIFGGIASAIAVQYVGTKQFGWPIAMSPSPIFNRVNYWYLAAAFIAIFVTGLIDDRWSLKPMQKFAGQIIAATIAVAGGLVIGVVVDPINNTLANMGWIGYPITIVYLVAYANIFNLIDGLDGLASGVACIAAATMFVLSMMAQRPDAAALAIAIVGSTLGFLRYNYHPASIFLGDSGSLLLGFALGTVSLLSVKRVASLTTIIVPLVASGIPIMDTFSAIIRRKRAHVSVGHADRGHIHHRLLDEGYDQRQTVLFIYVWTAFLSVGAIILTQVTMGPRIVIFILLVAVSILMAARLKLFHPVLLHHYNPHTGDDEIITPADPAFRREEERFEEEHQHLPFIGRDGSS